MLRFTVRASLVGLFMVSGACASGDLLSPSLPGDVSGGSSSTPTAQPVPVGSTTGGTGAGATTGSVGTTTGGASATTTTGGTATTTTGGNGNTVAPAGSTYAYVGRFDFTSPNAPVFGLLSGRIGATFTGTSLSGTFTSQGLNLFNVTIDGGAPSIVTLNPSANKQTIALAAGLPDQLHTVWISKRTEYLQGSTGNVQFFGFTLDASGQFGAAPATSSRHIEFSGDSGFTGFGADQTMTGPSDYCSFSEATQNGDKSIPAYTGAYLNADVVNLSSSGQAVYESVYDSNPNHLLPYMYDETTPPLAAPKWDFGKWTADVVVLDGGGDDLAGDPGVGTFPNEAGFVAAYEAWVDGIRQHYPKATIVVVLSQAAADNDVVSLGGALQKVVADVNAAGDPNVYYFNFYQYPTSDPNYQTYDDIAQKLSLGYGCSYHPSDAGSQWLGKRLAAFIQSKMGW